MDFPLYIWIYRVGERRQAGNGSLTDRERQTEDAGKMFAMGRNIRGRAQACLPESAPHLRSLVAARLPVSPGGMMEEKNAPDG